MYLISIFSFVGLAWGRRKKEAAVAATVPLGLGATGIPVFRRSIPDLARELARARRSQRPLSVVVLTVAPELPREQPAQSFEDGGNGAASFRARSLTRVTRLVALVLGAILRDALRESDIVTYDATGDRYLVLLTETNRTQARQMVQRLDELFFKRTFAHLRAGIAEFPGDRLTLEDLVGTAQTAWEERPVGEAAFESAMVREQSGVGVDR